MIVLKVRPESWLSNPLTFSRIKYLGFLSDKIRATSIKSVPRVSSNPRLFPAIEKDWQGNPAQRISKSGSVFVSICLSPLSKG